MIDLSLRALIALAVKGFLCGAFFALLYELLYFGRLLCGEGQKKGIAGLPSHLLTFFLDLTFLLSAGICGIFLIWSYGSGFRGMTFLLMALGFLLCRISLGRLVRFLLTPLAKGLRKLIRKLLFCLLFPFRQILLLLISLYHLTIGRFLGKIIESLKKAGKKTDREREATLPIPTESCGKEEHVYVTGATGYRKEGRISFGSRD